MEMDVLADPKMREFLSHLMWARDVFTRETFLDLLEHGWSVPTGSSLENRLRMFAYANKRTKINDDLFRACRKRGTLSDANFSSRRGRWDTATRSSLISDYDRRPLQVSANAKDLAGKTLAPGMFDNKAASEFSLGEQEPDTLHKEPADWPSPSPLSYKLRGELGGVRGCALAT